MAKIRDGIFTPDKRYKFWEDDGNYEMAIVLMNYMSARFPNMVNARREIDTYTAQDAAKDFSNMTGIPVTDYTVLQYWGNLVGKPLKGERKGEPMRIVRKDGNGLRADVDTIRAQRGFTAIDWSRVVR